MRALRAIHSLLLELEEAAATSDNPAYRIAYRWVQATGSDDLDLAFRLAILEGAALPKEKWGRWSGDTALGLREAQEAFAETNISDKWFKRTNTGFYKKLLDTAARPLTSSKLSGVTDLSAEGILTNAITGITKSGGTRKPLATIGKNLAEGIKDGTETPQKVLKPATTWVWNHALTEIRDYKRSKDRYRQDYSGEGNIGDRGIADKKLWEKDKLTWFAQVFFDPTDQLGVKIRDWLRDEFGKMPGGKYLVWWLDESIKQRKQLTQRDVAQHFGVKSQGLSNYFGEGAHTSRSKAIENFWSTPLADELEKRFVEEGGTAREASSSKVASHIALRWMLNAFLTPRP